LPVAKREHALELRGAGAKDVQIDRAAGTFKQTVRLRLCNLQDDIEDGLGNHAATDMLDLQSALAEGIPDVRGLAFEQAGPPRRKGPA
jgi:hypothetical protein